jgi:hypothetical protein
MTYHGLNQRADGHQRVVDFGRVREWTRNMSVLWRIIPIAGDVRSRYQSPLVRVQQKPA